MFPPITKKPEDFEPDIFIAAKEGKLSSVQYLIEKEGINVNKQAKKYYGNKTIYKGDTALHIACENNHLQIVQYLIEKGANIEIQDCGGKTSLHFASLYGNTEVVKYLVSKGANKNAKTKNGKTPYDIACNSYNSDKSQINIIQSLLR